MITAIIVISTIALAAVFTIAWLTKPALRRQIEQPKYCFQDQVQQYNQQCRNAPDEETGSSDEP